MYYSTRACILASAPSGERGKLLSLLTEERGLVTAHGQGMMPARSKLGGSLTTYRILNVTLVSKAHDRVIGVEVEKTYARLWADARRQGYAAWGNEWLMKILKEGAADERIFRACETYYEVLNAEEEGSDAIAQLSSYRLAFASMIIEGLGYRLDVEERKEGQGERREEMTMRKEMIARARYYKAKRAVVFEAVERWTRQMGVETMKTSKFLTAAMK